MLRETISILAAVLIINAVVPAADSESISINITLSESRCQLAVWLEDDSGQFVETVYVSRKVGQKGLGNRGGGLDDKRGGSRFSSLPVWANKQGIDYGDGNYHPTGDHPLPDAISGASPKAGEFILQHRLEKPLPEGNYHYFVEVNKSFDDNEHHNYSWYRGQPSVVWKGKLSVGGKPVAGSAAIIGHGHPAGADGIINPDISTLTSARELIQSVKIEYKPKVDQ